MQTMKGVELQIQLHLLQYITARKIESPAQSLVQMFSLRALSLIHLELRFPSLIMYRARPL